ncbi:MAG: hypothetical protein KGL39_24725 [Patescibacteria group bacterium]|nr:hypothetical protein [Patescibacteria group bacterium]
MTTYATAQENPRDARRKRERCETCRHWEIGSSTQSADGRMRYCFPLNDTVENVAWNSDAVIVTPPDFGCALWEAKELEGEG